MANDARFVRADRFQTRWDFLDLETLLPSDHRARIVAPRGTRAKARFLHRLEDGRNALMSRPSRLGMRSALLSEIAGTSPAMTNGEPYPSSGFMFASLMILA